MSQSEREELLREPNVAVLATVGSGDRAHAAPIWYLYEDGVLIMSTGAARRSTGTWRRARR